MLALAVEKITFRRDKWFWLIRCLELATMGATDTKVINQHLPFSYSSLTNKPRTWKIEEPPNSTKEVLLRNGWVFRVCGWSFIACIEFSFEQLTFLAFVIYIEEAEGMGLVQSWWWCSNSKWIKRSTTRNYHTLSSQFCRHPRTEPKVRTT